MCSPNCVIRFHCEKYDVVFVFKLRRIIEMISLHRDIEWTLRTRNVNPIRIHFFYILAPHIYKYNVMTFSGQKSPNITTCRPCTYHCHFFTHSITFTQSPVGLVFAIHATVVNPPLTADLVPVSIVSLCSNPGSL